ncbi:MAG TPA: hypothetical protein VF363_10600 [Candidatus Eisenbacteria bacterium]
MLRISAAAKRVRITGVEDLLQLPPAGICAIDPWARSHSSEVFERLCRTLGAHLGTVIEDRRPDPEDGDPAVLDRLLQDIREEGYDLWAVNVAFGSTPSGEPSAGGRDRVAPLPPSPRTRFFVVPAARPH